MAIPTVDQLLQPTMDALHALGGTAAIPAITEYVLAALQLPPEEAAERDPRHNMTEVEYRLAWARTYLKKYGLAEDARRGVWALTEKGRATPQVDPREVVAYINLLKKQARVEAGEMPTTALEDGQPEELPVDDLIQELSPTGEPIRSLTPHLPDNTSARHFITIMDGVSEGLFHGMYAELWTQRGNPQETVDWADPFLIEALETCRSLSDVEALLDETHRDGGMMLFAVDGKTNDLAVFECLCAQHFRRDPVEDWIIGTNHFCACEDLTLSDADAGPLGTLSRFGQIEDLLRALRASPTAPNLPADLIQILADDAIERRGTELELVTVYANVACPSTAKSGTRSAGIQQQAGETGKDLSGRDYAGVAGTPGERRGPAIEDRSGLEHRWRQGQLPHGSSPSFDLPTRIRRTAVDMHRGLEAAGADVLVLNGRTDTGLLENRGSDRMALRCM